MADQSDNQRRIAVVGQGVIGLTSAHRLLEAGFHVTVFSREELEQTTSFAAGAYWWPHRIHPEERVAEWSKQGWNEYQQLAEVPETGVHMEKHVRLCVDPDDSAYVLNLVDSWERITGDDYGISCHEAFALRHSQVKQLGAEFRQQEVSSPGSLFPEFDLVVNCTGVNAFHFVDDADVYPIRGQTVCVSLPSGLRASTRLYQQDDHLPLILPRRQDVVLGGTAQVGEWSREPDDGDTESILNQCRGIVPELRESETLGTTVGLRPGRPEVRLDLDASVSTQPVLHNYGHGGGGYTVAWGCASETAQLVSDHFAGGGA